MTRTVLICLLLALGATAFAQDQAPDEAALAKASQNPVANMISIPLEFWHNEGDLGPDWNVLLGFKFILPK